MYARAGATPPVRVTLRMKTPKSIGTSAYCGAPTRLTVPPSRATPNAVSSAGVADALQHGVGAIAAGEFAHALDALLAALGDHVRGAELAAEVGALLVPAHEDDLLGT